MQMILNVFSLFQAWYRPVFRCQSRSQVNQPTSRPATGRVFSDLNSSGFRRRACSCPRKTRLCRPPRRWRHQLSPPRRKRRPRRLCNHRIPDRKLRSDGSCIRATNDERKTAPPVCSTPYQVTVLLGSFLEDWEYVGSNTGLQGTLWIVYITRKFEHVGKRRNTLILYNAKSFRWLVAINWGKHNENIEVIAKLPLANLFQEVMIISRMMFSWNHQKSILNRSFYFLELVWYRFRNRQTCRKRGSLIY